MSDSNLHANGKNTLVAFFSHSGNTRKLALQIHKFVGGDIHEITPVKPYPSDYNAVVDQAKMELYSGHLPELKTGISNMDPYDVILLGYPNWWGTLPRPVVTMLSEHDVSNKTIVPFCTHEGSGMGRSNRDLSELCPQATVRDGLAVRGSRVDDVTGDIRQWLGEAMLKN